MKSTLTFSFPKYTESKKFYKEFDSTPDDAGEALIHLQTNLKHIEHEILNLESRVNDLRALKQLIIKELHEIGRDLNRTSREASIV